MHEFKTLKNMLRTNKKIKVNRIPEGIEHMFNKDRVHIVFGEKRDEYLIMLTDCKFHYVWKNDCEIIKEQVDKHFKINYLCQN